MTTKFNFNVSDEFGRNVSIITEEDEEIYDNEAEMYVETFKRFMRAVGFVEDTIEKYIPSEKTEDEDLEEDETLDLDEECNCSECVMGRIRNKIYENTVTIPESTTTGTNNERWVWTNPIYVDKAYTSGIYTKDTRKGK